MNELVGGFVDLSGRDARGILTRRLGANPAQPRCESAKAAVDPDASTHAGGSAPPRVGGLSRARETLTLLRLLRPLFLGLAFARAGVVVAGYDSYRSTDSGLFTDGATLIALGAFLVVFVVLAARKASIPDHVVTVAAYLCIATEFLSVIGVGVVDSLPDSAAEIRLVLCAAATFFGSAAVFYWLRRVKGATPAVTAVVVFAAIIVSEVELYLCALLPETVAYGVGGAFVLAQYPCMAWERSKPRPCDIESVGGAEEGSKGFFGPPRTTAFDKRFLVASAVGVGLLSVVIGFLRGYPDGIEIPFTPPTRLSYALVVIAVGIWVIALALTGRQRMIFVATFAIMELLACVTLVLYGAFPDMLELGAVFATALNALMVAFTHYVTVFFMTCGWRDPYYYAIAGRFIWMGCRALSRMALPFAFPSLVSDAFSHALVGLFLIASTQIVFMMLLSVMGGSEKQGPERDSKLARVMGIDDEGSRRAASLTDIRQEAMARSAAKMGAQFLLSEREIEVLALYAQGFTQKSVGEKLFISQGTVHAHIKRIYAKTGLHSRQELLNYLERYAS